MTDIIIHNHDDLTFSGAIKLGDRDANTLTGTDAADIIAGDKGDDIIEGGKGDDLLIGGELHLLHHGNNAGEYTTDAAGADTFVFNFALSHTEATTYYFRPNAAGTGGDTPNINANLSAWQNYVSQLAEWRSAMAAEFGADADQSMTGVAQYTVKKAVGTLGAYDNSFTVGGDGWKIDSHDGTDTILQFGDSDTLKLNGLGDLNASDFDDLFDVALDARGDTVLSWAGGSITVDGLSIASIGDFYSAGSLGDWFA